MAPRPVVSVFYLGVRTDRDHDFKAFFDNALHKRPIFSGGGALKLRAAHYLHLSRREDRQVGSAGHSSTCRNLILLLFTALLIAL